MGFPLEPKVLLTVADELAVGRPVRAGARSQLDSASDLERLHATRVSRHRRVRAATL